MRSVRFSAGRMFLVARTTWVEAVRQRLFALVLVGAGCVVASSLFLREFNFGASELKFIADFGFGAMTLFGSVLAIVATAQVFFGELENRTVLTLLAKPVLRSEFVLGKFVGVGWIVAAFLGVVALTLICILKWRALTMGAALAEAVAGAAPVATSAVVVFTVLQGLKLLIVCAFTLLIASYAQTHLFTVLTSFVVLVICHLQPTALGVWERAVGWGPKVAGGALAVLVPNFQLFNVGDAIATGAAVDPGRVAVVAGYAVVYVSVVLALAVWSFRHREI